MAQTMSSTAPATAIRIISGPVIDVRRDEWPRQASSTRQPSLEKALLRVGRRGRKGGIGGLLPEQRLVERLQARLGALDRHALAQPREHLHPAEAPALELQPGRPHLRQHGDGDVDLGRLAEVEPVKSRLHDADDLERMAVDGDRLADDGAVAGKARHPVVEAKHGHRMSAGRAILLGAEQPTDRGPHAELREERARHQFGSDQLAAPAVGDCQPALHPAEHAGKDLVVVPEIAIHRVRQLGAVAHAAAVALGVRGAHLDQLAGPRDWQRAQHDLVHQREDGGVGGDAERHRQHGDGGEQRHLAEAPDGVPQVGGEVGHGNPPSNPGATPTGDDGPFPGAAGPAKCSDVGRGCPLAKGDRIGRMNGLMMDVPLSIPLLLRRTETLFGHKPLVSRRADRSLERRTYGEVLRRARGLAAGLAGLGVKPGDRVATFCWNHSRHLEAYYGMPAAGFVLHTLNIRLHADELAYIITHAGDAAIIVDKVLWPAFAAVLPRLGNIPIIVISDDGDVPPGRSTTSRWWPPQRRQTRSPTSTSAPAR